MTDWNLQQLLRMLRLAKDDAKRARERKAAQAADRAAASQRAVNARRFRNMREGQ